MVKSDCPVKTPPEVAFCAAAGAASAAAARTSSTAGAGGRLCRPEPPRSAIADGVSVCGSRTQRGGAARQARPGPGLLALHTAEVGSVVFNLLVVRAVSGRGVQHAAVCD